MVRLRRSTNFIAHKNIVLQHYQVLGAAVNSKRAVSVVFIPEPSADSPYESSYTSAMEALKIVHPYMGKGEKMVEEGEEKAEKKSKKRSAEENGDGEPEKKKKKKDKKE